ncbi:MAG: cache domain-containing protein [Gammaproteobacteria bacterium]
MQWVLALVLAFFIQPLQAQVDYASPKARALVELVNMAALRVEREAGTVLVEFAQPGSRWRRNGHGIFVLGIDGTPMVRPTGIMADLREGTTDLDGRRVLRQMVAAANRRPGGTWVHHLMPASDGGEVWVRSYVRKIEGSAGRAWIVGSSGAGLKPERGFAEDLMESAIDHLTQVGRAQALKDFRAPRGAWGGGDVELFVQDRNGRSLKSALVPSYTRGREAVNRQVQDFVRRKGRGWVEFHPKGKAGPKLAACFRSVEVAGDTLVVGARSMLPVPKGAAGVRVSGYSALIDFVKDAAKRVRTQGPEGFDVFRRPGRWRDGDVYVFVWSRDGRRLVYPPDPGAEGMSASGLSDAKGKHLLDLFLHATGGKDRSGWAHYQWPRPGETRPVWKSTYLVAVTGPGGGEYLVGSGLYNMSMRREFIKNLSDDAREVLALHGVKAFDMFRDPTSPFQFMDAYVRLFDAQGREQVNGAFPGEEGQSATDLADYDGIKLYPRLVEAARSGPDGGWVEYRLQRPFSRSVEGLNAHARFVDVGGQRLMLVVGLEAR